MAKSINPTLTELESADILTEEERKELSEMPRRKDETITMKCIHCGHEEEMPVDVYGEEADYLIDIGDTSHPVFNVLNVIRTPCTASVIIQSSQDIIDMSFYLQ